MAAHNFIHHHPYLKENTQGSRQWFYLHDILLVSATYSRPDPHWATRKRRDFMIWVAVSSNRRCDLSLLILLHCAESVGYRRLRLDCFLLAASVRWLGPRNNWVGRSLFVLYRGIDKLMFKQWTEEKYYS